MVIRARAPLRIGFGGGGTDVRPYCDERGGIVLNATINRYACATVIPGGDQFRVHSLDYDASLVYNIEEPFVYDGQLDLAKVVLDHFRGKLGIREGLEIYLHNDAPPGSGLGSSSAITVALIGAISEYLRLPFDSYQIADLAYRLEREEMKIQGGKQDQYTAAFGGYNFMEFHKEYTVVNTLRLRPDVICELEYSLVFAYVGGTRLSSHLIEKQVANYERGEGGAVQALDTLKELAYEMKRTLLMGKLREFGELLHTSWQTKQQVAEGISNPRIDEIYEETRKAGALGGKITGAGGGGFMFFFCDPFRRFAVQDALRKMDAQLVSFSFVEEGLRAWTLD
jgi:D-glycero-alpha-D-manno-heptose-7-phosphate kinase